MMTHRIRSWRARAVVTLVADPVIVRDLYAKGVLPATPVFSGSEVVVAAMLYIPQWVNAAVSSYKITTKLRVLPLGLVQDSAGDWSPPGLPSIEQTFVVPFGGMKL